MADTPNDTIMFVGAHHDDNELMAGTILKHVEDCWRVVSVVMTDGRYGREGTSDANIRIRNNESLEAAKLLGMTVVFLGFVEAEFRNTPEACQALMAAMTEHQPRVMVTHPPLDYHFDHMETSKCVRDATYLCRSSPAAKLYYCDAWFVPFLPDLYVDVSDHVEPKKQSLACHHSQMPEGGKIEGSMVEMELVRARFRGLEAGCQYAEAYRLETKLGNVRMAERLG